MMRKRELYWQVARLHVEHINQGFLASLGDGFLALMYRAIDEAKDSFLLVEEHDGRIAGFVAGASGMGPIYRQMLRHPFRLVITLSPSLLIPKRAWRIFEILRYSRGAGAKANLPRAELLSIAVSPHYRCQGMAERLYCRLRDHFLGARIKSFKIIVGESLAPAHRFYRRMGAVVVMTIQVHRGSGSLVYVDASGDKESEESSPKGG